MFRNINSFTFQILIEIILLLNINFTLANLNQTQPNSTFPITTNSKEIPLTLDAKLYLDEFDTPKVVYQNYTTNFHTKDHTDANTKTNTVTLNEKGEYLNKTTSLINTSPNTTSIDSIKIVYNENLSKQANSIANMSITDLSYTLDGPNRKNSIQKVSELLLENHKKYVKSLDSSEVAASSNKNPTSNESIEQQYRKRLIETISNVQVYYVDFELTVNELLYFEPKTGSIEVDAIFKYKWWDSARDNPDDELHENTDYEFINKKKLPKDRPIYYPGIEFKNKNIQLTVKNQVQSVDNVEFVYERKEETQESILAKFEKLKSDKNVAAVAAAKVDNTDDIYITPVNSTSKRMIRRYYSFLEQNITVKFKCKPSEYNAFGSFSSYFDYGSETLDTSRFPFDYHLCELDFDLVATPITTSTKPASKNSNEQDISSHMPVYLFAPSDPYHSNRIELEDKVFDLYNYNKLVKAHSNYSWITREWLLKKITVFYTNSTSPLIDSLNVNYDLSNLTSNIKSIINDYGKFDHILVSRKDMIDFKNEMQTNKRLISENSNYFKQLLHDAKSKTNFKRLATTTPLKPVSLKQSAFESPTLPNINIKFYIYRRREPQVYVFVLPLVLFTLITFVIFFLPTSNTSEKTLIAFLNFACLLVYNFYVFKLVIFSYEFMRIPMLLQYSNCLMVVQLGVLAYACLVKSVYHYGFLTFNSGSFSNAAEDAYREIMSMNNLAIAQPHPALDLYSLLANSFNNNQNISSNSGNPNNNNHSNTNDDTDTILYHGCEKVEQTDCMINSTGVCNLADRYVINKSSESVKISMPIIRLDGEAEGEAMNAITTIANDNENYIAYNNIESALGAASSRCVCNAMETDADCCNAGMEQLGQNGNVSCGAGTPGCNNDPDNKLISLRSDLLLNANLNMMQNQQFSSMANIEKQRAKFLNGNWVLTKFCCGSPNSPGVMEKISPSPICEHVRPIDNKRQRNSSSKQTMPSTFCVSSATTRQLLTSECDYTSHLARLRTPLNNQDMQRQQLPQYNIINSKTGSPVCNPNYNRINQGQCRNVSIVLKPCNETSSPNLKANQNEKVVMSNNNNNQVELASRLVGSSSFEMYKLNFNMQKLVKMEEIYVKEKIIKEEWKRKARLCDGICCLLVFFLLVVCSAFIFIILPTVKTSSLMD